MIFQRREKKRWLIEKNSLNQELTLLNSNNELSTQRISDVSIELTKQKEQFQALQAAYNKVTLENENNQKSASQFRLKIHELNDDAIKQRKIADSLKMQVSRHKSENTSLINTLSEYQQKVIILNKELNKSQIFLKSLELTNNELENATVPTLHDENKKLKQTVSSLTDDLSQSRLELDQIKNETLALITVIKQFPEQVNEILGVAGTN